MRKLQEIVRIISRRRIKKIEILNEGNFSSRKSLYYRFYTGIKEGLFRNDEDAAQKLFGTDATNKRYLMLKSRIKDRLLNTLIFLEKSPSRYEQAFYKCNRDFFTAKFLFMNGARETAISLMRKTLAEATRFSLNDVALDCLRELRYQASFSGNKNRYKRYSRQFKHLKSVLDAEYQSEELLQDVLILFARTTAPKMEMAESALSAAAQLKPLHEKLNSRQLSLNYFRLLTYGHQIKMDFPNVVKACDQAEHYLLSNPHLIQNARLGEFALTRMVAYMHMGHYEKGKENAEKCINYYVEGSINWMIFLEHYFLLCMHTGNYAEAADVHQRVVNHPRFSQMDELKHEKWKIFGAFLRYMLRETSPESSGRFNLLKFLNEVPLYSRDKRGMNINILILQILFLLDRKDFDGIIKRTEALKIYCSRYLRKDDAYRSNCFLKMMLIMEKKDFNWRETERIAEKYFQKLVDTRFHYEGNPAVIEIIPYEQLWKAILNKLRVAA